MTAAQVTHNDQPITPNSPLSLLHSWASCCPFVHSGTVWLRQRLCSATLNNNKKFSYCRETARWHQFSNRMIYS